MPNEARIYLYDCFGRDKSRPIFVKKSASFFKDADRRCCTMLVSGGSCEPLCPLPVLTFGPCSERKLLSCIDGFVLLAVQDRDTL